MPPRIDADARRREIAGLAARLVATRGPDISLRSLAAEAGASTTVITHFFANKAEVLEAAYRASVDEARGRVEQLPGDEHPRRIELLCEAVLPLDEARRLNWLTWLGFMGAAIHDPRLAALQRSRVTGHRALLEKAVAAARQDGRVHPDRRPADEARSLVALVHGVASHAVFHLDDWPADRQTGTVRALVSQLRYPPADRSEPDETGRTPDAERAAERSAAGGTTVG